MDTQEKARSGTGCKWTFTGRPSWLSASVASGTTSTTVTFNTPLNTPADE